MSTTVLDLKDLDIELKKSRSKLDGFLAYCSESSTEARDNLVRDVADKSGRLHDLEGHYCNLKADAASVSSRLESERIETNVLHELCSALKSELKTVETRVDTLNYGLDQQKQKYQQIETEIQTEQREKQKNFNALKRVLQTYSSGLGLEFVQGEDLQLIMTQIDSTNPERKFRVFIHVDADNSYQVTRCEPQLDDIPALVAELNVTSNFSAFVKILRKKFKDSCL